MPGPVPLNSISCRPWPTTHGGRTIAAGLLTLLLAWAPIAAQAGQGGLVQDSGAADEQGRLFVPPPRELSRPLIRARQAIADQDYRQAVELLGRMLADSGFEDYLLVDDADPHLARSIQLTARELLGKVPDSFLSDYELRYSVTARQMLEQAVAAGDYSQLARVARHYFYTRAGQSATMLLGHHFLESGQLVSATRCFSQIVSTPAARRRHDPDAAIMLAMCQLFNGAQDDAAQTLMDWANRAGRQPVVFQGQPVQPFTDSGQAIAWLTRLTGDSPLPMNAVVDNWTMYRGDPTRNAAHGTGVPLPRARWRVPTLNDPVQESLATQVFESRLQSGTSLVPSLQPLAIGNTVVMRSLNRLIGIDFETGKRIWEFPAWLPDSLAVNSPHAASDDQDQISDWHVRQRIWHDHLYGQISSNGRDVYVIDQPGFTGGAGGRIVMERGLSIVDPLGGRNSNELKCIELARQGAFRWQVGGTDGGNEPALAGCFFLGAPVPGNDGTLYAICELDGEIRAVALQQQTGQLIWTQQIASIDSIPPVGRDPLRRLAAASPSLASGILVCPTSATGLVAIDLATRSLIWGVRYPGTDDPNSGRDIVLRRQPLPQPNLTGLESRSVDSSVTIAGNRVIVAPIESDRLFCFDLMSGEALWHGEDDQTGQPREDGLYVACVYGQTVVLAGQSSIRGLDLKTGQSLWHVSMARYGEPVGRGFLAGDRYFIPTDKSLIAELDISRGEVRQTARTEQMPGNLICHRGDLISQGFDQLSVYRQYEPLRQRLAAVAANNRDEYWQCLQAQVLAHEGKLSEAVALASQAWQSGHEPFAEKVLTDLILDWVMTDYPGARQFADQYSELFNRVAPAQFRDARLRGSIEANEIDTALDLLAAYPTQLATGGDQSPRTVLDDHRTVLEPEQALKLRLRHGKSMDPANRSAENRPAILDWLSRHGGQLSPAQLQRLADWTGYEAFDSAALLELAESQIRQGEFLLAEQTLDVLQRRPGQSEPEIVRCRLLKEAGWLRDAAELAQKIAERDPDRPIADAEGEFPARELVDRLLGGQTLPGGWDDWKYGAAETRLVAADGRPPLNYRMIIHPVCVARTGNPPDGVNVQIDVNESQIVVHDSLGHELGRVNIKTRRDNQRYHASRMASGRYALHGHLLILSFGYDLVAIDLHRLRAGDPSPLWRRTLHNETGFRESILLHSGVGARPIDNPWGIQRSQITGRDGNIIGTFASNGQSVWYLIGEHLYCVNALTGRLLWQRTNIKRNSRIVAGRQRVYVLEPVGGNNRAARYDRVDVLDARFGLSLDEFPTDTANRALWQTVDDIAVFTNTDGRENVLAGIDLRSGEDSWEYRCPRGSLGCFRDPSTMAIYRDEGILEYLDLRNGEIQRRVELQPVPGKTLQLQQLRDHDLIQIGLDQSTNTARPARLNRTVRATTNLAPLFDGHLFCIDLANNRARWTAPVRIEHFSIPAQQPADVPVMSLGRIVSNNSQPRAPMAPEFYTIDLRDGRLLSIYRQENLSFRTFLIRGYPETQTAELLFGDQRLVTRLTGADVPPTAPAQLVDAFTMMRATDQPDSLDSGEDPVRRQQEILRQLIRQSSEQEPDSRK